MCVFCVSACIYVCSVFVCVFMGVLCLCVYVYVLVSICMYVMSVCARDYVCLRPYL